MTAYASIPPTVIVEGVYPVTIEAPIVMYTAEEVEEILEEYVEKIDYDSYLCFCLRASRVFGAKLPFVDAKDLKRNSVPTEGGVVILKYGSVYHTAYIQFILKNGMWLKEGNFIGKCKYSERYLDFTDSAIIGFYYEQ